MNKKHIDAKLKDAREKENEMFGAQLADRFFFVVLAAWMLLGILLPSAGQKFSYLNAHLLILLESL